MLRELLSIFRTYDPLRAMGQNFATMLTLACEMTVSAGEMFFTSAASPEARTDLYQHDVRLNQLERKIRKQVVAHLSMSGNRLDVPYSSAAHESREGRRAHRRLCEELVRNRRHPYRRALGGREYARAAGNPTGCGGVIRSPVRGVRQRRPRARRRVDPATSRRSSLGHGSVDDPINGRPH